jgi:hypothetical protein
MSEVGDGFKNMGTDQTNRCQNRDTTRAFARAALAKLFRRCGAQQQRRPHAVELGGKKVRRLA